MKISEKYYEITKKKYFLQSIQECAENVVSYDAPLKFSQVIAVDKNNDQVDSEYDQLPPYIIRYYVFFTKLLIFAHVFVAIIVKWIEVKWILLRF